MSSTSFRRGIGAGMLAAVLGAGAFLTAGAVMAGAQTDEPQTAEPNTTEPGAEAQHGPRHREPLSEEERAAARACMAEKGFELPEPQLDDEGNPIRPDRSQMPERTPEEREAFRQAAEECGLPLPRHHGGPHGPGRGGPGGPGQPGGPGCDEAPTDEAPPAEDAPAEPEAEGSS